MLGCSSLLGLDRPSRGDAGSSDGSMVDAPTDAGPPDVYQATCVDATCTAAGGVCDQVEDQCVIDQNNQSKVTCPTGMKCRVVCNVLDACRDGVDCSGATECTVRCTAGNTCRLGGVDCGQASVCNVTCIGNSACEQGATVAVDCRTSTCTVTCSGSNACMGGIGVDPPGTCTSHCCNGACQEGFDTCVNDAVCQ